MGVRVKVSGALSGSVDVQPSWTGAELHARLAELLLADAALRVMSGGRIIQSDTTKTLQEYGISGTSRILVTRIQSAEVAAMNEAEQRQSHLARLLVAVDSLSSRCGGRSEGDYELTLENQQGQVLTFDNEGDRKALVTGLMLNARAKRLMEAGKWSDALETLVLCEEAFACAHPTHVEAIDNVGLVHMDIVWCIFQLQDASRMAVARGYLEKARAGLTRAHGSNLERLRTLQGGFKPVSFLAGPGLALHREWQAAREKLTLKPHCLVKRTGISAPNILRDEPLALGYRCPNGRLPYAPPVARNPQTLNPKP